MERKWVARPYKYADGVPWNSDRYEIFVTDSHGDWVSVGGAIRSWSGRTIAFLSTINVNRLVRTPLDAQVMTDGLWVAGDTVRSALKTLKWKYQDPQSLLQEARHQSLA